jgi:acyl-CoA thioester hydrolase
MNLEALPICHQAVIPESYLDGMGHMNVMWYTHLFSRAIDKLFTSLGLDREYFKANHAGTFALEQHVRFRVEVRCGQHVTIRARLLGRSAKRFHFMQFMFNDDAGVLSATVESIGTHVDLRARRSSPLPPHIAEAFDRLLAEHESLAWPAPVCGVMRP